MTHEGAATTTPDLAHVVDVYLAMRDRDPIIGAFREALGLVNHHERLFGPDRGE